MTTLLYTKIQLEVQRELFEAIDISFCGVLEEIFKKEEWLYQDRPVPGRMLRPLCPLDPTIGRIICAFCPGVTFTQAGRALEHIQGHFGLRPFQCAAPEWYVLRPGVGWAITGIPCSRKTFLRKNELKNHTNTHAAPGHIACPNNWSD